MLTRRSLVVCALAAPAIIRTPGLLMPIKPYRMFQNVDEAREWLEVQISDSLQRAVSKDDDIIRVDASEFFERLRVSMAYSGLAWTRTNEALNA